MLCVSQVFSFLSASATHRCRRPSEFRTVQWVPNVERPGHIGNGHIQSQAKAENLDLISSWWLNFFMSSTAWYCQPSPGRVHKGSIQGPWHPCGIQQAVPGMDSESCHSTTGAGILGSHRCVDSWCSLFCLQFPARQIACFYRCLTNSGHLIPQLLLPCWLSPPHPLLLIVSRDTFTGISKGH